MTSHHLAAGDNTGSSNTWIPSNRDVVRHPTRYGLGDDNGNDVSIGREWLFGGRGVPLDYERGLRPARGASLLVFALPGSAYLYQWELSLTEVVDIPAIARQDPTFLRNGTRNLGRDGCRGPLPWAADESSFGSGATGNSHLPQPNERGSFACDLQDTDAGSILNLTNPRPSPRTAGCRDAYVAERRFAQHPRVRTSRGMDLLDQLRHHRRALARRRGDSSKGGDNRPHTPPSDHRLALSLSARYTGQGSRRQHR